MPPEEQYLPPAQDRAWSRQTVKNFVTGVYKKSILYIEERKLQWPER